MTSERLDHLLKCNTGMLADLMAQAKRERRIDEAVRAWVNAEWGLGGRAVIRWFLSGGYMSFADWVERYHAPAIRAEYLRLVECEAGT